FLAVDAMQCGYCTAGMIMSGAGVLKKNPNPTEPEILHAMEGNVCRCGTYPRVVAAIQQAANSDKTAKGGAQCSNELQRICRLSQSGRNGPQARLLNSSWASYSAAIFSKCWVAVC